MPINHARHRRRLLLPLVSALLLLTSCGVLVDRSGPEVSISLGTGSEGEVVVTARARDPESGVASLRLYRLDDGDGALLSEASGGDGGAEAESTLGRGLEVTALVEAGTQEVAAVATNGVGKAVRVSKVVGSGPVAGAPDEDAPAVNIVGVTPSVAGFLNRERVTIEYVANDNAGLERVDLFVSVEGGERKLWSQQPVTGRTYQGSFAVDLNSPDFAYGLEIAFILEAVDAAGNLTTVTAPAYTLVDREPPVIEFISPLGSFEGSFVSVSFTVADNDELAEVALLIDGVAVSPITNSHGSNFYHYGWHVTSVEAGLHTLTAVAVDASGNVATQTVVTDIRAEE